MIKEIKEIEYRQGKTYTFKTDKDTGLILNLEKTYYKGYYVSGLDLMIKNNFKSIGRQLAEHKLPMFVIQKENKFELYEILFSEKKEQFRRYMESAVILFNNWVIKCRKKEYYITDKDLEECVNLFKEIYREFVKDGDYKIENLCI